MAPFVLTNESVRTTIENVSPSNRTQALGRPVQFRSGLPAHAWQTNVFVMLPLVAMGLSYGAVSGSAGFPWWQTLVLAVGALSGAAELTFVGVIAAGGAPALAVLAGLLVNSRNFAFGLAVGPYVPGGWRRLAAAHLVNDETTAFSRSFGDDATRWRAFVLMATTVFLAWPSSAVLGQWIGSVIDADLLGLDVAFPIILFCLIAQDTRHRTTGTAVLLGAVIAVIATPFVPAGLGPILGLAGLLPALMRRRGTATWEPR